MGGDYFSGHGAQQLFFPIYLFSQTNVGGKKILCYSLLKLVGKSIAEGNIGNIFRELP